MCCIVVIGIPLDRHKVAQVTRPQCIVMCLRIPHLRIIFDRIILVLEFDGNLNWWPRPSSSFNAFPENILSRGIFTSILVFFIFKNSLTALGNSSFKNCSALISIDAPNVTSGNYNFSNCNALTFLNVPKMIGASAEFERCSHLTELIIPKCTGASGNKYGMFDGCSSLVIIDARSFTNFGYYYQFRGCSALRKIILPDTPPNLSNPTRTELNSSCLLYVKSTEIKEAYLAHSQWKNFAESRYVVSPEDYE